MYEAYLEHHGIKGQKWGERRFQNMDGSLTPAGRSRYGVGPARKAVRNAVSKLKSGASRVARTIGRLPGKVKEEAHESRVNKALAAIASGDSKNIVKYANVLTDSQLNNALNRARTIDSIKNVGPSTTDKVMKALDLVSKGADTVTKVRAAKSMKKKLRREEFEYRRDQEKADFELKRDKEKHRMDMRTAEAKLKAGIFDGDGKKKGGKKKDENQENQQQSNANNKPKPDHANTKKELDKTGDILNKALAKQEKREARAEEKRAKTEERIARLDSERKELLQRQKHTADTLRAIKFDSDMTKHQDKVRKQSKEFEDWYNNLQYIRKLRKVNRGR